MQEVFSEGTHDAPTAPVTPRLHRLAGAAHRCWAGTLAQTPASHRGRLAVLTDCFSECHRRSLDERLVLATNDCYQEVDEDDDVT